MFKGRYHNIPDAGIKPLPSRSIPIWFGGHADEVLQRVAKQGDGWLPNYRTVADCQPALDALDKHLAAAGRSRKDIGLEPRVRYGNGNVDEWVAWMRAWEGAGATHMTLITEGFGFDTPQKHIEAIRTFAQAVGVGK